MIADANLVKMYHIGQFYQRIVAEYYGNHIQAGEGQSGAGGASVPF
jgi:hypothetical protein